MCYINIEFYLTSNKLTLNKLLNLQFIVHDCYTLSKCNVVFFSTNFTDTDLLNISRIHRIQDKINQGEHRSKIQNTLLSTILYTMQYMILQFNCHSDIALYTSICHYRILLPELHFDNKNTLVVFART